MDINLPGYQILETLNEGVKTAIYRGSREQEPKSVVIKTLLAEYPTLEEITRIRHEYNILKCLDIEGVVKTYVLENYRNGLALVLEDFREISLKNFINSQKIDLILFIKIAIKLAITLSQLHQNHVIHKDIKPHNILIDPESLAIRLIDFSIATRLTRETQAISNPNLIEGTLAYMSPEQTGRMNRSLDYRTDFYSLGVTFYEILTGQLPFTTIDPMELVHSHIAFQPIPPHQINSEIPKPISDIVMKLLAKNSEDRYQSGTGLQVDLEECLIQIETTGTIKDFIPGKQDKSGQFLIPQKLYGREREVQSLIDAFEQVSLGTSEIVLVSGYSGVGKTSVVNEVHKPIVGARGYFIAGKFDQFKRDIPYAALIQAFQELVRQLLTESPEQIELWKQKLEVALGPNGQVIIDVIPEVELIIGQQPPVPQLGPTESQNRFHRVFQQFIHIFSQKEHPLVLFLDDLQWADTASLNLIKLLVTDLDSEYLLLIGAYRDNEIFAAHPLMLALEEIQQIGVIVKNIVLQPLELNHVSELITNTLSCGVQANEQSKLLAELLFNKTQGNPFFLTQILQTLYAEKLLHFDFVEGRWLWNIEKIQTIGITDYNVVELVAKNIQKLSIETQKILKLAACIGNYFTLEVLAIVNEKSIVDTANDLWEALQAGLILPLSNAYKIPLFFERSERGTLLIDEVQISYKFLHDRVQQAAYSLIPDEEKKLTHLKTGQLLLKKTPSSVLEENIFDIVNQLNIGVEYITLPDEKERLASLNLRTGQKAKTSMAYEASIKYLTVGLELLPEKSWENLYELTLKLYIEAAEAEYLNTNYERAEVLSEIVLHQTNNLLDSVRVYELKIQFYMAQNQLLEAINTGLFVLQKLGVPLLTNQIKQVGTFQLPSLSDLDSIPEMTDPYHLAALRILITIIPPSVSVKPQLIPQIVLTQIDLCLQYGNSGLAAFAYTFYGNLLCLMTGNINTGYHAGQLALKLLERFNARELNCKVYHLFNIFIRHWKEPLKDGLESIRFVLQNGLETGDIEYGGYAATIYSVTLFLTGERLEIVEKQQNQYLDLVQKLKQNYSIYYIQILRQLSLNLLGDTENKYQLVGKSFNEIEMLPILESVNNQIILFVAYLAKTILLYLFKETEKAVASASLGAQYAVSVMGMVISVPHNFYYSLALLAQYKQATTNKQEQEQYLSQVETNQQKMQQWAENAPANYQHKYDLVEAEKARILGNILQAQDYYDRAIAGAKNNGYIQEEALANELAAEFYLACGRINIAKTYMTEAYYGYIRWGALAKVKDLDDRYPQLIFRTVKTETSSPHSTRTTTATTGSHSAEFDLATVVKASQAISGEIVLENLLDKMMKIIIENAGAQKGYLLARKDNQWIVEAKGVVNNNEVIVSQSLLPQKERTFPLSIIHYIEKTKKNIVLDEATSAKRFAHDQYIITEKPKSILCFPILHQGKLNRILYLENNLTTAAFTSEQVEVLKILMTQVSISIENASLYTNLQAYSQELEVKNSALQELSEREREKATLLAQSLDKLKQTQAQLVHTEKISSLGQLVAGIAHEVNNPVSFIAGNLHYANNYVQDLLNLLELYAKHFPNVPQEIQDEIELIELDYLKEDLPKMLSSMQIGTDRIKEIMQFLRNFSRVDEDKKKCVDIHSGIESTLMILQHRLKAKQERPEIVVIKEYGNLPLIECYVGQLNQVFMNILANAIDAFDELNAQRTYADILQDPNQIKICTQIKETGGSTPKAVIRIADNGPGIPESVQQRLFDPFFTTKPVGKGTGLGLSISYQIVVEKHQGMLQCVSAPGQGTEFIIEIPVRVLK